MKRCSACNELRSDDQYISKKHQRKVKTCLVCRNRQSRYRESGKIRTINAQAKLLHAAEQFISLENLLSTRWL